MSLDKRIAKGVEITEHVRGVLVIERTKTKSVKVLANKKKKK